MESSVYGTSNEIILFKDINTMLYINKYIEEGIWSYNEWMNEWREMILFTHSCRQWMHRDKNFQYIIIVYNITFMVTTRIIKHFYYDCILLYFQIRREER